MALSPKRVGAFARFVDRFQSGISQVDTHWWITFWPDNELVKFGPE